MKVSRTAPRRSHHRTIRKAAVGKIEAWLSPAGSRLHVTHVTATSRRSYRCLMLPRSLGRPQTGLGLAGKCLPGFFCSLMVGRTPAITSPIGDENVGRDLLCGCVLKMTNALASAGQAPHGGPEPRAQRAAITVRGLGCARGYELASRFTNLSSFPTFPIDVVQEGRQLRHFAAIRRASSQAIDHEAMIAPMWYREP